MSGGLIVGICLFLKGPQPLTRVTRAPIFEHFVYHFVNPGLQNAVPGRSQNHQNLQKSLPGGLPKSTLEKDIEKASILSPSGLQTCVTFIVGSSKTGNPGFQKKAPKMTSKSLPKWSLWAPQITKNQKMPSRRVPENALKNVSK